MSVVKPNNLISYLSGAPKLDMHTYSLGVSSRVVTHKVYRVETTLHASRLGLHSTDHLKRTRGAESS